MYTKEFIEDLIKNREKEKANLELKSFEKVNTTKSDGKTKVEDFMADISAIANRFGGKILIGINDNGTFEGKFAGDFDNLKGQISEKCRSSVSPIIDCDFAFIETIDWDVIVVLIPKRKNIPHALIKRENGHEITNRKYYIRTPYGKKLATDAELEWLFKNQEEPIFEKDFRLCFEFDKFNNCSGFDGYLVRGGYEVNNYLNKIPSGELNDIFTGRHFKDFLLELIPYFILNNIAQYYSHSWCIGMNQSFDRESSGPVYNYQNIPSEKYFIHDIKTSGYIILNNLSIDYKKEFNSYSIFDNSFYLPIGSEIKIDKKDNSSSILISNKFYKIEIFIGHLSSGSGIHPRNPSGEALLQTDFSNSYSFLRENFRHFDGAGYVNGEIYFEDQAPEDFKRLVTFYETTYKIIDLYWNYNSVINDVADKEVRIISTKIDEILKILKRN